MRSGRTRRDLLRAAGTVAAAGLAGCSALPAVGAQPPREITDWLYRPTAVGKGRYTIDVTRPARLAPLRKGPLASVGDDLLAVVNAYSPAGLPLDRIDAHVKFDEGSFAITGDFDKSTLVDRLTERGFSSTDSGGGPFDAYATGTDGGSSADEDPTVLVGVRDGELVGAIETTSFQARIAFRALVEARTGVAPRYPNEDAVVGQLIDHLSGAARATIQAVPAYLDSDMVAESFTDLVGVGKGLDVAGGTASGKYVLVFKSMLDPKMREIRAWVGHHAPDERDYTFSQDGKAVVVGWRGAPRTIDKRVDIGTLGE